MSNLFKCVPLEEILEGAAYFIAHPGLKEQHYTVTAGAQSASELEVLALRGLVHRTKEEAVAHACYMWVNTTAVAKGIANATRTCRIQVTGPTDI